MLHLFVLVKWWWFKVRRFGVGGYWVGVALNSRQCPADWLLGGPLMDECNE